MPKQPKPPAHPLPPPAIKETTSGPPPFQWLIHERIPLGRITLLTGPADSGKTAVAADLAWKIAHALPWPAPSPQPAAASTSPISAAKPIVLFLTPFQNPEETALTRLLAANGQPENIALAAPEWKAKSPLATLITQLDRSLPKYSTIKLVVIDPMALLVSTALTPARQLCELISQLSAMALRHNVAFLAVMRSAGKGAETLRNSQLYDHAAAVYILSFDPENPNQRIMQTLKFPGCQPPASLQVEISPSGVICKPNQAIAAVPQWARWTNDQAASGRQLALAVDFLGEILGPGPMQCQTILTMAKSAGISPRTLFRAKKEISAKSYRVRGLAGFTWVWSINRVPSENFGFTGE